MSLWTRRKFLGTSCAGVSVALSSMEPPEALTNKALTAQSGPEPVSDSSASQQQPPLAAAQAVLARQLGVHAQHFRFRLIPAEDDHDVYEVEASGGTVSIAGSSGVALCRAAYRYLRDHCNAMITWSGRHLDLPAPLPDQPLQRAACPYKYVQYLNPCTFSYTMAFWDWPRWEREIDWMSLHGINMPLALEGQEAIWQKVWLSLGLTQREIDHASAGPAFLPWHRMGNIDNFSGPLPQSWIDDRAILQRKILDRMRSLGMKPIVPAFAGFVPQGFQRVCPEARTFTLLWLANEFKTIPRSTHTFILHPAETALYRRIGKAFIEEYKKQFGAASFYLADTFNELAVPVSTDHRYDDLERFGRTIYEGIRAGDPDGTWVMQSWLFVYDSDFWDNASVAALLRGVPNDRMLILDYANDLTTASRDKFATQQWKTQRAFFGKQWMHGMAHTFGGNNNVKGNLALMATEPASVLHNPDRGNLAGWAICPEGIENNEVVYELLTDVGWSSAPIDLDRWLASYCTSRYGKFSPSMQSAWRLLRQSAYGAHVWMTHQAWQSEPSLEPSAASVDSGATFQQAVELFLACDELAHNELYRNDLIELVVQAAGGHVDRMLQLAVNASTPQPTASACGRHALDWLQRMDALLHTRPDRRLETWTDAARARTTSNDIAAFYALNARQLITTWGWPELNDYASRVWSGLIRDYYAPRWLIFLDNLHTGGVSIDLWQQTWLASYRPTSPTLLADPIAAARQLFTESRDIADTLTRR